MLSGSYLASRPKFSSAQFSPNCSRCVSKTQTNASRVPIDHESAAREAAARAGGKDCKTAGAAPATNAMRQGFPDPIGRSRAISLALGRRAVRVPSRVRRFRQFVHDTVHTWRERSAPRRPHFVARREERSQTVYPQKPPPVSWMDPWELREKPAALVVRF